MSCWKLMGPPVPHQQWEGDKWYLFWSPCRNPDFSRILFFNPKAVDEWMCHHLSVRREMDISDWQTSLAGSKDFDPLMLHKPGSPVCITCGLENRDCPGHMGFGDSKFWVTGKGARRELFGSLQDSLNIDETWWNWKAEELLEEPWPHSLTNILSVFMVPYPLVANSCCRSDDKCLCERKNKIYI